MYPDNHHHPTSTQTQPQDIATTNPKSFFSKKRRTNLTTMDYDALAAPTSKPEANDFLQTLLNKNLRITTTDGRMFLGNFKCTDSDCNIVLQDTHEYRAPTLEQAAAATAAALNAAAAAAAPPPPPQQGLPLASTGSSSGGKKAPKKGTTVKVDMTSRYLGLVVVPGQHIVKIHVEEFASQLNKKKRKEAKGSGSSSSSEPQPQPQQQQEKNDRIDAGGEKGKESEKSSSAQGVAATTAVS